MHRKFIILLIVIMVVIIFLLERGFKGPGGMWGSCNHLQIVWESPVAARPNSAWPIQEDGESDLLGKIPTFYI